MMQETPQQAARRLAAQVDLATLLQRYPIMGTHAILTSQNTVQHTT
jgi:hypothetical protein